MIDVHPPPIGNLEEHFKLSFEFPINEGYIYVDIRNGIIKSAPVAMCLECGDVYVCEDKNCLSCEYENPEMIKRWERIQKVCVEMQDFLEEMALDIQSKIKEKLENRDGEFQFENDWERQIAKQCCITCEVHCKGDCMYILCEEICPTIQNFIKRHRKFAANDNSAQSLKDENKGVKQ